MIIAMTNTVSDIITEHSIMGYLFSIINDVFCQIELLELLTLGFYFEKKTTVLSEFLMTCRTLIYLFISIYFYLADRLVVSGKIQFWDTFY